MLRRFAVLSLAAGLLSGCGGSEGAESPAAPTPPPDPIIQTVAQLPSQGINTGPIIAGQSVTVTGGPFDNLRFRFFVPPFGEPANGPLFLLDREYLGTPDDLGPAAPGFIAMTTRIEAEEWVFDPGVSVAGNVYWFLTKSPMRIYTTQGNTDQYPGGDAYTAASFLGTSFPFLRFTPRLSTDRSDMPFQLRGSLTR